MAKPLISCIMLTTASRDRLRAATLPGLLGQAGAPPFEIVFALDRGEALPMDQAAAIARSGIPYRVVTGAWEHLTAKQNGAAKAAKGDWFTFWDDDDWSAPNRLSTLTTHLGATGPSLVGPDTILYHELVAPTRYTAKFQTGAKLIDRVTMIRRSVWEKTPFIYVRPYSGIDPGNVGHWIMTHVNTGTGYKVADFPYVAMMHRTNTSAIKRFRVDPITNVVFDGPKEYTLLGGREAVEAVMGAAALAAYELAAP